jgi:uncharacterized protein YrrD
MQIDLGMTVYASGGEKVGTVEKIVLDTRNKTIAKFIVHHGGMSHRDDKLVDVEMVTRDSEDGIYLDLPKTEFNDLPAYVEQEYVVAGHNDVTDFPMVTPGAVGGGSYLIGNPAMPGETYQETVNDTFFAPVSPVAPVVETRSNVRDIDVVIDKGTDVVGSDGEKVGTVHDIVYGDDGALIGFVVQKGWLFKKDMRVPVDLIAETGETEIRLNVPGAEAETRAYHVDDTTL